MRLSALYLGNRRFIPYQTGEVRTLSHSRKKLDLNGQRFGKLRVLRPTENVGRRTAWLCRCDCGRETVALTGLLRNGHCTSCGCDKPSVDPTPGALGRASLTYVDGTCLEVLADKAARKTNISGVRGVHWMNDKHVWRAEICFKGERRYLGIYRRLEDAVNARKRAEAELYEPFLREFARAETQNANG